MAEITISSRRINSILTDYTFFCWNQVISTNEGFPEGPTKMEVVEVSFVYNDGEKQKKAFYFFGG